MARKAKRSYRRARASGTRRSRSRKFSMWKLVKGIAYTGAIAAPVYTGYQQLGGGAAGATGVVKAACFVDPATNTFSLAHGTQIWGPVAVLAVVDFATTKLPIQSRVSRGINNLLG